VVANSGTALSNHQIRLLHRFTQNIVLLYDGDEAGIHAAMRGTDMLLAEGMNIKVLVLPDGDDPDSFSKKHTADEFKAYIEQHQTDFIQFKTDLLLKGVTDPQKRSEAVSSILKSVSVIPDKLKRDTYLSECSHRFNVNEQALVTTVNTYIQRDKEEKQKERERNEAGMSESQEQQEELIVPIGLHTAQEQTTEVERLLIQNIIRHGDEIIYEGVETDDGQTINLNVAQYVDYDLGADGLQFSNPLFNRILQEAVEHSGDAGFKADLYFMQHPDPQVSQLAASLGIDRHQLSRSFQVNSNSNLLRQRIEHLILDFRMDIVSQHLKELQRKMKEVGSDMTQVKELMEDYKQTQELRNALARQRGSDVIV
jgi:DNA primase